MQKERWQYRLKSIKSGDSLEWYEFEQPVKVASNRKLNIERETPEWKKQEYRNKNYSKSKKELIRLIQCNLDLTKFLTLTFAEPISDIKIANKLFKEFIQKLRYKYNDFKYVAVPELQMSRAEKYNIEPPIHYHLLCNLPYIRQRQIELIWGNGIIDIRRISHVQSLGLYIAKYLTKETFTRLYKKKKYFVSRNIKRPTILYDDYALQFLTSQNRLKKTYETQFPSPFSGSCKYINYVIL